MSWRNKKKSQFKMCSSKRRYTAKAAHRAAERINQRFFTEAHIYQCPYSKGNAHFHIGRTREVVRNFKENQDERI